MSEDWLWPLRGGTWKERHLAVACFIELLILWAGLYALAWLLTL